MIRTSLARTGLLTAATVVAGIMAAPSAFAQDPAPSNPGDSVSQPAPSPSPPSGDSTNGAPSNGAAPTPAGASPTAPAQKDKGPDEDKPPPPEARKPRKFAGTQLFFFSSMYTGTVFKGQVQDYNPTVDGSIWFLPRYSLSKNFQLRGRSIFSYEYTNSDATVTQNEPRFSDTTVSLFYNGIPAFAGIKPGLAFNLAIPTSPESRARTMVVTPGASFQLVRPFENVLGGELVLVASAIYSHPLYTHTTAGVRGDFPYLRQCLGGAGCADQLTGTANPSDVVSWTFVAAQQWGKFDPSIFVLGSHQFAYTFQDLPGVQRLGDRNNVRQSIYIAAALDYLATSWLTAEIGYSMSRSVLNEDSTYGNPVFDRNQDTRVYAGLFFNLDNIAKELEGGGGEGGQIRSRNNTGLTATQF